MYSVISSPVLGNDGTVYVGSMDRKVYALNGQTGSMRWEFETGGVVSSSPTVGVGGIVYVGSADGKLYALDGQSGVKKWEFLTEGDVYSSPVLSSGGNIYFGSYDRQVYAVKANGQGLARSPWPMRGLNPQRIGRARVK